MALDDDANVPTVIDVEQLLLEHIANKQTFTAGELIEWCNTRITGIPTWAYVYNRWGWMISVDGVVLRFLQRERKAGRISFNKKIWHVTSLNHVSTT